VLLSGEVIMVLKQVQPLDAAVSLGMASTCI
jgi:hypothetical protein